MLQAAAGIAAVLVAFWPQIAVLIKQVKVPSITPVFPAPVPGLPTKPKADPPSYAESIMHLAIVRTRLVSTALLGDEQKKSIDVLTLALVEGSDK